MQALFTLETVAVLLALVYVVLAIRQNPWCWLASAFGAAIYMVLFFEGRLFMESFLQLFYVVMAGYGLWAWSQGGNEKLSLPVTQRTLVWHATALLFILVVTSGIALILYRFTTADAAFLDTLTTVASLVTTWMVARKIAENWLYWVVIDAIYVYLFATKGYYLTAILYSLFLGMAAYGYITWRKQSIN